MPDIIPFREVAHLFTEFKDSAWRLETQHGYASDRGGPKWERWQRGETLGYDPGHAWHANVRAQTREGRHFERVRVVDSPPTEGQRFLLASGLGNVEAGEDIRNMWRADAERLALPGYDFWLFDSRTVARFHFDEEQRTVGVELLEDPASVVAACRIRDAAWHHAVPTAEFSARVRSIG
ncbi:DUF6879 family protein [Streptomyces sp. RKAG337]|uniref:DUF6879 family protein n=1 Tax=Streptomyces sp. RKAG337 TaxID=2893404 RepID=UPI0020347403|nr:DUF6879 family protein [Streptomyces sp. RKAG337]MCM2429075.1 hypothetical protein [Streptomyces sp. RKAG337]